MAYYVKPSLMQNHEVPVHLATAEGARLHPDLFPNRRNVLLKRRFQRDSHCGLSALAVRVMWKRNSSSASGLSSSHTRAKLKPFSLHPHALRFIPQHYFSTPCPSMDSMLPLYTFSHSTRLLAMALQVTQRNRLISVCDTSLTRAFSTRGLRTHNAIITRFFTKMQCCMRGRGFPFLTTAFILQRSSDVMKNLMVYNNVQCVNKKHCGAVAENR